MPFAGTMSELVAATVQDHPDRVAIDLGGDRTLVYRELWDLAGRVEAYLRGCDDGAAAVGICAARTPAAFAGYLGALRLGAAVVPLHPAHPIDRLLLTAQAAGVAQVLVDDSFPDELAAALAAAGIRIHRWSQIRARAPRRDRPTGRPAHPDGVAYILFTSGSTGIPKAVPIQHRAALAYLAHNIERYEIGPGHRLSHCFDLTFDPSVFDLFAAWGSGATLVVPKGNEPVRPDRYIRSRGITHFFSVPSVVTLASALRALGAGTLPDLRWSMFIGDQLTWTQADAWRSAAPASVIENVYGPTELTVACAAYRLPADPRTWPDTSNGTVPIGTVYAHLSHLILDDSGRPANDGELCVRGVQRFPGYLDPGHNTGSFVTVIGGRAMPNDGGDPLTPEHWYRTGDRVRREGANLVHIGRLDRQVQLHGCRVEPGEVEAALRRHAAVTDAAVVLASGRPALHAFCTGSSVDSASLMAWLRTQLPQHMVPERIEVLPRLPLTHNGKIDRHALTRR